MKKLILISFLLLNNSFGFASDNQQTNNNVNHIVAHQTGINSDSENYYQEGPFAGMPRSNLFMNLIRLCLK